MPFFRRFRPVVKSEKHEVTWSNLAQNASTTQTINICNPVDPAQKDGPTEVLIGSQVRSLYLEFHFSAQVVTNPKVIHWFIIMERIGQTTNTPSTYYAPERSQIFKRGMEMLPADQSTVFKRIMVVKIPRFMQRQKENSDIRLEYICSSTETINACGFCIYKELN